MTPKVWGKILVILPIAGVIVLAGILARACDRAKSAENNAARLGEYATELAGKFNAARQDTEALKAQAKDLFEQDAILRAQKAELEKRVGKVKIVEIVKWRTIEAPATGTAVPVEPGGPVCVLRLGDGLYGSVNDVRGRTEKGNLVALGTLHVERTTPTAATLLDQPFEVKLSSFTAEPPPPPPPRWSLGGGAWWKNPGWTAEARGGMRLVGDFWLEAAARFDNQYAAGARWEFR